MNLIPHPKSLESRAGQFAFTPETHVFTPPGLERPEFLAIVQLVELIEFTTGSRPEFSATGRMPIKTPSAIVLTIDAAKPGHSQGYELLVEEGGVRLTAPTAEGLLNGIRTLIQLVSEFKTHLPCVYIQDEPAFKWRGFYFDVSRGRVARLETIKWLIDYLARHKINMFQLYIEHPFAFRFDPEIPRGLDAMTHGEMIILNQYCHDRRIEFVPSLQSFGHMGAILSLPQYKQLADLEPAKSWFDMTWRERMAGSTFDVDNPEGRELLTRMYDEFAPLFDSQFFNVCADETWDLGKGKTRERAEKVGKATLYMEHINWLNTLCHDYGKKMMFWGDIVKQTPEQIPAIPRDAILMEWGYSRNHAYDDCRIYAEAGLDFFVCPGTSGWNGIQNNINNADLNIRRMAAAGIKYGALGYLNTDWGDCGHFNPLAGSLHGIALGGAMGWNPDSPPPDDFDRIWSIDTFGDADTRGIENLRAQTAELMDVPTWTRFYEPFDNNKVDENVTPEIAARVVESADKGIAIFGEYLDRGIGRQWVAEELRLHSRFMKLFGQRYLLREHWKKHQSVPAEEGRAFVEQLRECAVEFRRLWLERSKETDLKRVEQMIERIVGEVESLIP